MALLEVGLPQLLVAAGVTLVVMEALAPGAHFIILGIALLGAGLAGLAFTPLASPLALAGLVGALGAVTFFAYREFDLYGGKGTAQTSDSGSLTGQRGQVIRRVTSTDGEVKLVDGGFDPHYAARSFDDDIAEGEEVIVVDPGGGNVLTVASVAEVESDSIDRELARESAQDDEESGDAGEESADARKEREVESERSDSG